jgi:hypothetical protein
VVAGLVVFLQFIFIIGLRIVGQKVSDPYGDDLVDFSVMFFFMQFSWTQSNCVLNIMDPPQKQQPQQQPEGDNVEHILVQFASLTRSNRTNASSSKNNNNNHHNNHKMTKLG